MDESLVFLKPDAVLRRPIGAAILQEFLKNENFSILAFKEVVVTEQLAQKHYQEHEGKHFFPWLVKAVRASPVIAMIIKGDIQEIRDFLGATFVQKADPNTIRGKYGIWGGVNSVHASDSAESGIRELELWEKIVILQKEPNITHKIKTYIERWHVNEEDNTLQLRKLCRAISENPEIKDKIYPQLVSLLKKDCPSSDIQSIHYFANIIIENVLL